MLPGGEGPAVGHPPSARTDLVRLSAAFQGALAIPAPRSATVGSFADVSSPLSTRVGQVFIPVRDMPVWIRNEFHEDHEFVWFDKQGRPACICYGYTLPVLLARTDNTRFREWSVHNAENWALYASILFAMLVYPELDFTGEWIEARPAGELLHHNSMFSCFRSEISQTQVLTRQL